MRKAADNENLRNPGRHVRRAVRRDCGNLQRRQFTGGSTPSGAVIRKIAGRFRHKGALPKTPPLLSLAEKQKEEA